MSKPKILFTNEFLKDLKNPGTKIYLAMGKFNIPDKDSGVSNPYIKNLHNIEDYSSDWFSYNNTGSTPSINYMDYESGNIIYTYVDNKYSKLICKIPDNKYLAGQQIGYICYAKENYKSSYSYNVGIVFESEVAGIGNSNGLDKKVKTDDYLYIDLSRLNINATLVSIFGQVSTTYLGDYNWSDISGEHRHNLLRFELTDSEFNLNKDNYIDIGYLDAQTIDIPIERLNTFNFNFFNIESESPYVLLMNDNRYLDSYRMTSRLTKNISVNYKESESSNIDERLAKVNYEEDEEAAIEERSLVIDEVHNNNNGNSNDVIDWYDLVNTEAVDSYIWI